ncbi:hypothetical protein AB205_0105560 [Aquarana catesbeiana]|uniref:Uncharacterized protein n=1 Tax=Aquarana catesbeiana TaxID=8400 RepID=A0A2G9RAU0_AQUCT|nr:hypothetical protein AB205_0105560 [Aquarana catesbeiana]
MAHKLSVLISSAPFATAVPGDETLRFLGNFRCRTAAVQMQIYFPWFMFLMSGYKAAKRVKPYTLLLFYH